MIGRLLGVGLLVFAVVVVGKSIVENYRARQPITEWVLAMTTDRETGEVDPENAKIVQYVRTREECVDTAWRLSRDSAKEYFRTHPGPTPEELAKLSGEALTNLMLRETDEMPQTPRCVRVDHYYYPSRRTVITYIDE